MQEKIKQLSLEIDLFTIENKEKLEAFRIQFLGSKTNWSVNKRLKKSGAK